MVTYFRLARLIAIAVGAALLTAELFTGTDFTAPLANAAFFYCANDLGYTSFKES